MRHSRITKTVRDNESFSDRLKKLFHTKIRDSDWIMTKFRKLQRAAPLSLPDDRPLPCREPRHYGWRGPHLLQRTHQDHTNSVRCRYAVELAAMAISKRSIKFGMPQPLPEKYFLSRKCVGSLWTRCALWLAPRMVSNTKTWIEPGMLVRELQK